MKQFGQFMLVWVFAASMLIWGFGCHHDKPQPMLPVTRMYVDSLKPGWKYLGFGNNRWGNIEVATTPMISSDSPRIIHISDLGEKNESEIIVIIESK
jgi:hypothetical protein